MRKTVAALIILAVCAAVPGPAPASEEKLVLTLEDCLRMALERNPFYLAAREKEAGASAQVREAAANFFPSFNAQGTQTLDEKLFVLEFPSLIPGQPAQRISVDFTKNYQMAMSFSLPLFTGGRLISGFKQANYNLLATKEGIRQSRQETVYNVKSAFYGYLLAREFVETAAEALALAEDHFKNVKNLYEVGMASKFDLLRSEVQVANLQPQLIRARNALEIAGLGIKNLLGLDLDRAVEIKGELSLLPLDTEVGAALIRALETRPDLSQLKYQRQMAGELLKIARAGHLPTLAIGGAYNFWADKFNFGKKTWQNYYSVNLVLDIPLFNGFRTQAQVGQSKAMIRELEYTMKGLTETIKLEVQQAFLGYKQARESLLSQEKNVEQAREAVRIAELNYKEGLATNLDVSTAQVALSQAKTNYSQALYDCAISLAQLDKAIGSGWNETEEK